MSNIYVTEPATNGKVILKTTVGEIEIELWSKEAPKACRNFVQLCMERYYDDTAFHRLVRGFIVQGGDPTGTGEGGESVYGKPFKTEIHSRLSFNRRGLVGMACLAENMNASQFFFTLGPATELTGKHTLFGKVAGDTLFNMLRLGEGDVGPDERPYRLHRIVNTTVVLNPYDDIVPRQLPPRTKPKELESDAAQVTAKATKNFSLLSFGEEAEEEEHVTSVVSEKLRKKGKSAHDLLSDPRLSSQPVTITDKDTELVSQATAEADKEAQERRRRRQLAMAESLETEEEKQRRILALQQEAEELRRAILQSKRLEMELKNKEVADAERRKREAQEQEEAEAEALARWEEKELLGEENSLTKEVVIDPETFSADFAGYKAKAKKAKKGADREASTMALLERFTSRLHSVVHADSQSLPDDEKQKKVAIMDSWMASRLVSEEPVPAKQVLDPTMPHPDRYDLYDPRNPLNVRKRGGDISLDGNADHMKRKHKH
ncbi:peptidyl-prolyl cis-trans isomerase, cyclophilin-type [Opisthorchis viverrini]|uniref:Spliceosome-associated protein CWC27 homolog n=2 Tax=Opisthorchis viverrini TaxID=6198 RepID=A0A074ZEJ1_OPIVI|nr:hypothetical protein T265_06903 [Opisthorchis viverrini]KER25666.1 hypothetical protein T265_06903 [Opisthorchis viverrini]OON19742.1 peptidyl-prolyl cis-trans isomerase, cyclophilin-type [Opisthorchis viverrini]